MNIRLFILMTGMAFFYHSKMFAQFYTVKTDSERISPYRIIKKKKKIEEKEFVQAEKKDDKEEEKNENDSLSLPLMQDDTFNMDGEKHELGLMEKLEERVNVCLPLDFFRISSKYGKRIDPITKCPTFHDGIDLVCKRENVYSMLPAIVKKVHKGNRGYGNYVILGHGNLECLYGHLEEITVKEKEIINAGTIIGISGNTGKSTGYHLHIRLKYRGKSIDPGLYIAFLKDYMKKLDKELSFLITRKKSDNRRGLTMDRVYSEIVRNKILHPTIVLAQALLETGHFSSRVCLEYNNLFGLRQRNGEYYRFKRWEDSVTAYRDYVQYKYKGGDYFAFLHRIGYAEDKNYIFKVRAIASNIHT